MRPLLHLIACFVLFHLCAAWAQAQGWQAMNFVMNIDGEDRDKEVDYSFDNVSVYYVGNGAPNLMLTCSERRGITVAFGLTDLDFRTQLGKQTSKTRSITVRFRIDGKRTSGIEATHLPTLDVVEPFLQKHGRMVFNSVVREVPVTLSVPGKGDFTYTMPPVDDVFRQFVRTCPVTAR